MPIENLTYGVQADSLLLEHGVQNGDKILKVDDFKPETLNEVNQEILFGDARRLTLERDGKTVNVNLPEDIDQDLLAKGGSGFFFVRFPNQIEAVAPDSYADEAGLQKGDRILSVNNNDTKMFYDLTHILDKNKGEEVSLRVERDGQTKEIQSRVDSLGRLGFIPTSDFSVFFETVKKEYGFFESFPAGVKEGTKTLVSYVRSLKLIFSRQGVKQVGGFGTIAGLFGEIWDWERFWNMTALLSIILAVMNLLPIPALDGGHVMFLLYEIIAGRQPNQKFMEYAQLFGIAILLTLLLYANGNDVVNADWFEKLSNWVSDILN